MAEPHTRGEGVTEPTTEVPPTGGTRGIHLTLSPGMRIGPEAQQLLDQLMTQLEATSVDVQAAGHCGNFVRCGNYSEQ